MGVRRTGGLAPLARALGRGVVASRPRALALAVSVLATAAIYLLLSRTAERTRDLGPPGRTSMAPLADRHIEPDQPLIAPVHAR